MHKPACLLPVINNLALFCAQVRLDDELSLGAILLVWISGKQLMAAL